MKITKQFLLIFVLTLLLMSLGVSTVSAQEQTVVRAILFFHPSCGHCSQVISEVLPPLSEEYGEQFEVMVINAYDAEYPVVFMISDLEVSVFEIDITKQSGSEMFFATLEEIGYPEDQVGVPFLMIDDQYMVGSGQIPAELPGLIAEAVSGEGLDWPAYSTVQEFLVTHGFIDGEGNDLNPIPVEVYPLVQEAEATPTTETAVENTPEPTSTSTPDPTNTIEPTEVPALIVSDDYGPTSTWETLAFRFNHDRTANTIAVVVLLFLIGVVVYIAVNFMQAAVLKTWPDWILPVLLVIGLAIAGYLASIEVTGTEAVCGPVGDCNAVQQSKYATLFGFLHVAVFGIIGYLAIGTTWLIGKKTTGQLQFFAKLAMFFSALFGLLFFIYLTFLEPFVIGATCVWCITSAIIMAIINMFTLPIVLEAWADLDEE